MSHTHPNRSLFLFQFGDATAKPKHFRPRRPSGGTPYKYISILSLINYQENGSLPSPIRRRQMNKFKLKIDAPRASNGKSQRQDHVRLLRYANHSQYINTSIVCRLLTERVNPRCREAHVASDADLQWLGAAHIHIHATQRNTACHLCNGNNSVFSSFFVLVCL